MDVAIVIPARYHSRRLPGKPMVPVAGRSLLERVYAIAKAVDGVGQVLVTTDDQRIADHAGTFGASVVLTPPECPTGTDRVHAALKLMEKRPDAVINLQGDAVLTPPWVVQGLVDAFHADPSIAMVTPAVQFTWDAYDDFVIHKQASPSSGTTVVMDTQGQALYFSKNIIPNLRKPDRQQPCPVHRHIGIYGYSVPALSRLVALPPSPLEQVEQLEQLRALENRIPIQVVKVDYQGRSHGSVDTPEDIAVVEAIIAKEGELVP